MQEAAGVPLPPELLMSGSVLYVGGERSSVPPQTLVSEVSDKLRGKNLLFLRGKELGTVNPGSGDWEVMTPHDFCTWLPHVAGIMPISGYHKESGKPIEAALGVEAARIILASRELRYKLPVVERINRVRLPVLREGLDETSEQRKGFKKIELLPLGYDAQSRTFTVHGLDYDESMDPNEAFLWLKLVLKYFPWGDEVRSTSVQMAAMMTVFCRNLFIGKAPMFLWNSNLPGSGKSRLVQLALEPIFGPEGTGTSGWNYKDPQETRKELDATAQAFGQYIWFDDVLKGTIRSTDLNRWITSKTWSCRVMGTKEKFSGPLFACTFMTGNQVELDDNLERRTLIVDLFARQQARDRVIPPEAVMLDDHFFSNDKMLAKVLACLWALVRWWDQYDRPGPKLRGLESFEGWSEVVPGLVHCAGFGDCLVAFEAPDSGGQETREWKALAKALIREFCKEGVAVEVTMRDIIRTARLNQLFTERLWTIDQVLDELKKLKSWEWKTVEDIDPFGDKISREPEDEEKRWQAAAWTDRSLDSSWAKFFRKGAVAGQWFTGEDGKVYEFGDRSSNKGSKFVLRPVE